MQNAKPRMQNAQGTRKILLPPLSVLHSRFCILDFDIRSARLLKRLQRVDDQRRAAFFAEPQWIEDEVITSKLGRVAVEVALDELSAILVELLDPGGRLAVAIVQPHLRRP